MVSFSDFLFILLPCSYLFLFFLQKWRRRHAPTSRENPPPSPPKLPVVGNLHQLSEFPHRSLQSLSRRYGPAMLLHLGRVPTLIVSSAEAAREVMKNQDLTFANRPKQSIPGRLFYNYKDVGFSPYDENWRRVRSICVLQLLSSKRVQSYRRVREEETSAMVEKIMQSSTSTAVNLSEVVACLTNDVICRVALGEKYGHAMNFNKIFVEFMELLGINPMWEYIPWLSWTRRFDGVDERVTKVAKAIDEFLENVIQEHKDRNGDGDGDGDGEGEERERDFVDILLKFQREREQ